ncbi:MAG: ribose 5-phosphate isomerase B [Saprospiraceae bacterium]|nr:ribose 5-phosphate isomerase B [Saprospiraceae bacterium]
MTIALGADHAGFEIKQEILKSLQLSNISCMDYGTYTNGRVDYPDFAHPVALAVEQGVADLGILVCGSGNGVAITANKHQGIRAAVCWNEELARLARQHNNANIIAIPGRYVDKLLATKMVEEFLQTKFEGGRHESRVNKIPFC